MKDWLSLHDSGVYSMTYPTEGVVRFIKKYGPKAKNVFEFGSGLGNHFQLYQDFGLDTWSCEWSLKAVRESVSNYPNAKVTKCSYEELGAYTFPVFDLVVDRSSLCCSDKISGVKDWLLSHTLPGSHFFQSTLDPMDKRVVDGQYKIHELDLGTHFDLVDERATLMVVNKKTLSISTEKTWRRK